MKSLKKLLVLTFIVCLVPLFSGCNKDEEDGSEQLEANFKEKNQRIVNIFEKQNEAIWGQYTQRTEPSLQNILEQRLNANNAPKVPKTIKYHNFDDTDFDISSIDDGSFVVNDDFYVYINNDGHALNDIQIYFDTNGAKGPNQFGYDFFGYRLLDGDKLEPIAETEQALNIPLYFEID